MDQLTFSFTAVPSGTALYLVPQAADHAITLTRGTAAPETLDLVWNGSAFAVRTQQANEWVTAPSIEGWTFGQTASAPAGQAKYGEIIFTYASSEDGPFEAAPPSHAGSWYLKAEIAETPDYTGLSAIVPFTVAQAESTLVILTESLDKTYDGEPPVVPEVQKTGSAKDVRFQWQKNNGSEWVPLTDASVHVGEYKVIAILDGDTNYTSASAEKPLPSLSLKIHGRKHRRLQISPTEPLRRPLQRQHSVPYSSLTAVRKTELTVNFRKTHRWVPGT